MPMVIDLHGLISKAPRSTGPTRPPAVFGDYGFITITPQGSGAPIPADWIPRSTWLMLSASAICSTRPRRSAAR